MNIMRYIEMKKPHTFLNQFKSPKINIIPIGTTKNPSRNDTN